MVTTVQVITVDDPDALKKANNLSDLTNPATARSSLGLGTSATHPTTDFDSAGAAAAAQAASLQKSSNLSDLTNTTTARTNLGLGSSALESSSAFDAAGTGAAEVAAHVALSDPHTQYLKKAGGTVSGNIAMSGYKATGAGAASSAGDYVEYAQWLAALSGTNLINGVVEPDIFNDSLSSPPGSPIVEAGYLVGPSATGAWAGKEGHVMSWTGSAWNDQLGRVVAIGDKFIVTIEFGIGSEGGNMVGNHNKILTVTDATPGAYAYAITSPTLNSEFSIWVPTSLHFGDKYHYEGTQWVELPAPSANLPGAALEAVGNTWNVKTDGTTVHVNGSNQLEVPASTFDAYGSASTVQSNLNSHTGNTSNPHATTKAQVGLTNVTDDAQLKIASNLSDLNSVPTARVNLGVDKRAIFNNAPYSILATDRYVAQTGTMSASRIVTLPLASSVNPGQEIIVADESGTVTTTFTIAFAASGSDTVVATSIGSANGMRRFFSNGVSKWTSDAGVLRASQNLADLASAATARTNLSLNNLDNVQQLPMSYLDTDVALAANSDAKVPSQKAVKSYAQPLDPTLTALAAFNSNGLLIQTASDTFGSVPNGTEGYGLRIVGGVPAYQIPKMNTALIQESIDHFLNSSTTSGAIGSFGWTSSNLGTGAAVSLTGAAISNLGARTLATGSTTTGRSTLSLNTSMYYFGYGETDIVWDIQLPTLSNATDRYTFYAGWGDTTAAGDMVDGVYFQYIDSASANWQIKTSNNSTRTTTTTSTAVVAATMMQLRINVNAAGTLATFYVNGTSVGTIATNIPTTAARSCGPIFKIEKSAGTASLTAIVDLCYIGVSI